MVIEISRLRGHRITKSHFQYFFFKPIFPNLSCNNKLKYFPFRKSSKHAINAQLAFSKLVEYNLIVLNEHRPTR